LGCRIHASPVAPVSLMILSHWGRFMLLNPSVPRGSSFGDDFSVPRFVCAVEAMRHPWEEFR